MAISGQLALQRNLDTLANNVANSQTYGFRAEKINFGSEISKAGVQQVAFSSTGDAYMLHKSGPVVRTDNPLDVAVSGSAFLAFETPAGTAYTRDGRMTITANGELQTNSGYPILDRGEAPVRIDPAGGPVTISNDGLITQNNKRVGSIGLFQLDENAKLSRHENSGILSNLPATPVVDFNKISIQQGHLEKSNVNPVLEIVQLVNINRQFDAVASVIDRSDQLLKESIKALGGAR